MWFTKVGRRTPCRARLDPARFEADGRLRRFHGGAKVVSVAAAALEKEWPFAQRMAQNAAAKKAIIRAAARLFQPDDSLFIDTGSTTIAFAEALATRQSLVTITNSPRIAATLAGDHSHMVFLIGGRLWRGCRREPRSARA